MFFEIHNVNELITKRKGRTESRELQYSKYGNPKRFIMFVLRNYNQTKHEAHLNSRTQSSRKHKRNIGDNHLDYFGK